MRKTPTIVLTGGGSGGHITPLLSLAHELKTLEPQCQVVYIGHKGDRFDNLKQSSAAFDFVSFIDAGKFRRYHGESLLSHLLDYKTLALNAQDFFKVIKSVGAAIKILRRVRPDVVFSKGGFVVVPVGIAARLLRIPIVTHDSDAVPGLANRIVGRWAKVNATGMPAKYYNYPVEKIEYVGVPVSASGLKPLSVTDQTKLKKELGLGSGQVLVVGGAGNGSKRLNDLTVAMAPQLLRAEPNLQVVHFCGSDHERSVNEIYDAVLAADVRKRVKVFGFTLDFYKYVTVADLIFSRAGATSLAEFALLNKACIIMPSPFLAGGHQLKNAEELTSHDAAVVIDEETMSDELLAIIGELLGDNDRRSELSKNIASLARPDAAGRLAKILLRLSQKDEQ